MNSKFKVGDRVRRIRRPNTYTPGLFEAEQVMEIGSVWTVVAVNGRWIGVEGFANGHTSSDGDCFERANENPGITPGDVIRIKVNDSLGSFKKDDLEVVIEVVEEGVSFIDDDGDERFLRFVQVEKYEGIRNPIDALIASGLIQYTPEEPEIAPAELSGDDIDFVIMDDLEGHPQALGQFNLDLPQGARVTQVVLSFD